MAQNRLWSFFSPSLLYMVCTHVLTTVIVFLSSIISGFILIFLLCFDGNFSDFLFGLEVLIRGYTSFIK